MKVLRVYVQLIGDMYDDAMTRVKSNVENKDFSVRVGVYQGSS